MRRAPRRRGASANSQPRHRHWVKGIPTVRFVAWAGLSSRWLILSVWLGVLFGCSGAPPAVDREGTLAVTVIAVHDGDTLRVRDGTGREQTVRLAVIDAPEIAQPFGAQARDAVHALAQGRLVRLEPRGYDRYGRTLAVVWVQQDGPSELTDLSLWLLQQGLAWHYRAHADKQPMPERWQYALAEAQAKWGRRGLWQHVDAVPPWQWRRQRRMPSAHANGAPPGNGLAPDVSGP